MTRLLHIGSSSGTPVGPVRLAAPGRVSVFHRWRRSGQTLRPRCDGKRYSFEIEITPDQPIRRVSRRRQGGVADRAAPEPRPPS